ncbi:MAG: hypothetical protein IT252_10955 [Chitinophagaceae bacterium]|nr:hypothetical protein [Chitinophagaceae bacterium]
MKIIYLVVFLWGSHLYLSAQNIGIGTTSPHSSAELHIASTSRGFLPPRMTSAQRNAIILPLNGLTVYDTDTERIYVYMDGIWRYILSNDVWAYNSTDVYNTTKLIGIGNANPQEKLHVTGNIRLSGDLQSSGEIIMNNPAGLFSFQNAAVDKAFLQLSGDNLRIGTFSGNTLGKFIVRLGGSDRLTVESGGFVGINVSDPVARLDVGGNINLSGKMFRTNNGAANMLPVAYGLIRANATIVSGSGNFSVSKLGTGIFRITSNDFNTTTVVIATPTATNISIGASQGSLSNQLELYVKNTTTGDLADAFFNFVAFTN